MDRLKLKKATEDFPAFPDMDVVKIYINGHEINEYLEEKDQLMPLYPDEIYMELCEGKIAGRHLILQCTCGVSGCNNISVKVSKKKGVVVWSKFRSLIRPLDYVKSFSFDKENYQKEMDKLAGWARKELDIEARKNEIIS